MLNDAEKVIEYKALINVKNEFINSLNEKIAELNIKIANKDNQIDKLWEHIDCLENSPFRRIYNWVVSIVKYRIKLVKIGDNK